jgi:hypothetical protein
MARPMPKQEMSPKKTPSAGGWTVQTGLPIKSGTLMRGPRKSYHRCAGCNDLRWSQATYPRISGRFSQAVRKDPSLPAVGRSGDASSGELSGDPALAQLRPSAPSDKPGLVFRGRAFKARRKGSVEHFDLHPSALKMRVRMQMSSPASNGVGPKPSNRRAPTERRKNKAGCKASRSACVPAASAGRRAKALLLGDRFSMKRRSIGFPRPGRGAQD